MGKLRYFLYCLFPKWFPLEEVTEEKRFRFKNSATSQSIQGYDFLQWRVNVDTAEIVLDLKHTYKNKSGKVVYEREETRKIPYRFAHAEPCIIRLSGENGREIHVDKLHGFPVVKVGDTMLDITKIAFRDFQSQPIRKGRILMNAKTFDEVYDAYNMWEKSLYENSLEILAQATV